MAAAAAAFLPGNSGRRCLVRRGDVVRNPKVSIGWKPQPAAVGRGNGVQAALVSDHTALVPVASPRKSVIPAESELLQLSDIRWRRSSSSDDLPPISPEKLDKWMTDSITEIVKNIEEAPFLLHIFHSDGSADDDADGAAPSSSSQPSLILKREPAVPGSWPSIRRRWDEGEWSTPDGVILVEELKGEEDDGGCGAAARGRDQFNEACEKTWGILVQGRGAECSACYILNTCRVRSLVGTCTHFCLVRAQCFGDTADAQLKKAFLVTDRR